MSGSAEVGRSAPPPPVGSRPPVVGRATASGALHPSHVGPNHFGSSSVKCACSGRQLGTRCSHSAPGASVPSAKVAMLEPSGVMGPAAASTCDSRTGCLRGFERRLGVRSQFQPGGSVSEACGGASPARWCSRVTVDRRRAAAASGATGHAQTKGNRPAMMGRGRRAFRELGSGGSSATSAPATVRLHCGATGGRAVRRGSGGARRAHRAHTRSASGGHGGEAEAVRGGACPYIAGGMVKTEEIRARVGVLAKAQAAIESIDKLGASIGEMGDRPPRSTAPGIPECCGCS